ncbi:unnamed protein product [Mytilus coruscus]|uniref:Uncharacterized protein n=1 Tax=Mytilus coruscus TaxID=42192 RepID=A0A6J8DR37_MYTCO|nr:unnamed protein product [Mytilus coruscus]
METQACVTGKGLDIGHKDVVWNKIKTTIEKDSSVCFNNKQRILENFRKLTGLEFNFSIDFEIGQKRRKNPGEKQQNTIKDGFTLQNWYNQSSTVDNTTISHSGIQENCVSVDINKGARSNDFTSIDIVSSSLQRQITDGKPDIRLNRTLTIQELIKAFGKYKRIMSKDYPERRAELDAYGEDIIDISNFYGSKYYDYHKMFSAKASTLLREHHVNVDWSKRDRDLFTLVVAGIQINVCKLCHMCDHTTEFCSLQLRNKINHQEVNSLSKDDRSDKYGRPQYF